RAIPKYISIRSSRAPRVRSHWRAPLSPRASETPSGQRARCDKEAHGHLSRRAASHWAGPRQGVNLRCAQSRRGLGRIALQSAVAAAAYARAYVTPRQRCRECYVLLPLRRPGYQCPSANSERN
ncbi:unnamed protein product, partial [Iphiclides podalirius]